MANKLLELFVEITTRGDADLTKSLQATEKQGAKTTKSLSGVETSYQDLADAAKNTRAQAGALARDLDKSASAYKSVAGASRQAATDHDRLAGSFDALSKRAAGASGGLDEVASSIRNVGTVAGAVAGVPAIIAGLGALPAVATAGAGALGQLSLSLGQAGAGFLAIGGTATAGAVGGLKAYTAAITSTVSASREAYEATHEARMEQLAQRREQILSTRASLEFNRQIDQTSIALTRVQAEIGNEAFPFFTRELAGWTELIPRLSQPLLRLVSGVTALGAELSASLRSGEGLKRLEDVLDFVADSGIKAANALSQIVQVGLLWGNQLIPYATTLQNRVLGVAQAFNQWAQSGRGTATTVKWFGILNTRMNQIMGVVENLAGAFTNIFQGLNAGGQAAQAAAGLWRVTSAFERVTSAGMGGERAIASFMRASGPALRALGGFALEAARQFLLLADGVARAGQGGGKIGTLATVINSLTSALVPIRRLLQETFIALGPVLADMIPVAAEFFSHFLGSSGPLIGFLGTITRIMNAFNNLNPRVQNAVVQLTAAYAIFSALGGPALVSVGAGLSFIAVNVARLGGMAGGLGARIGALVARFGGWRAVLTRVAGSLRFLLGPWGLVVAAIATGAVLIYRNWDRIRAGAAALVAWFRRTFPQTARAVVQAFNSIRSGVQRAWGAVVKFLRQQGQQVVNFFRQNWPLIEKAVIAVLRAIGAGVKRTFGPMVNFIRQNGTQIRNILRAVWSNIKTIISTTIKAILGVIKATLQAITGDWRGAWATIKNVASTVWKALQTLGKNFITILKNLIKIGLNAIKAEWDATWTKVKSITSTIWDAITGYLKNKWEDIKAGFNTFKENLISAAQAIASPMRSAWEAIGKAIHEPIAAAEEIVRGVWNSIANGVNRVLDAVGIDKQVPLWAGNYSENAGKPGKSGMSDHFGRARGGVDAGPAFARGGGLSRPRDPKTITWGEGNHEEAAVFITKDPAVRRENERYMQVGASLLGGAYIPSRQMGENPRAGRQGRHVSGVGEGLGPTHYNVDQDVRDEATKIANAVGGTWNSYVGHGEPGGSTSDRTVDIWGPGGRGSPIGASGGYKAADMALAGGGPPVLYIIRQGEYWRGGSWRAWPQDPHMDHTHISYNPGDNKGVGGAMAGGGATISLWDSVGNALWDRLVQTPYDRATAPLESGMVMRQGAKGAGQFVLDATREYIIDNSGQTSEGGTGQAGQYKGQGGSPAANRALGQKMLGSSGVGGSWSSLDQLWQKESGWSETADNPTSSAYGIPQAMTSVHNLPQGYGPPGGEPNVQIDWGLGYIKGRYGTTDSAWQHSQSAGWYHDGGLVDGRRGQDVPAVLQAGELVVPAAATARLLSGGGLAFAGGGVLSNMVDDANRAWGFGGNPLPFRFGSLAGNTFGFTSSSSGTTMDSAMWHNATPNMRMFGLMHERGHQGGFYDHLGPGNIMQPGGVLNGTQNPVRPTAADRRAVGAPENGEARFGEPSGESGRPSGSVPASGGGVMPAIGGGVGSILRRIAGGAGGAFSINDILDGMGTNAEKGGAGHARRVAAAAAGIGDRVREEVAGLRRDLRRLTVGLTDETIDKQAAANKETARGWQLSPDGRDGHRHVQETIDRQMAGAGARGRL